MSKEKVFKISDDEIKRLYLEGNSLSDIAKIAQDTKGLMALRDRLRKLGVDTTKDMRKYKYKISKSCKKYHFNEHVFDIINTEEKAYWLGWLFSDGYNHVSKGQVALRLQEEDAEILYKFQKFLQTDAPVHSYSRYTRVNNLHRNYSELIVCSPYFCEQLSKLGCVQAKTLILQFPDISEHLYQHFIRGYFDGDGCFSVIKRKDRKNPKSKTYQFNIVGMESVLSRIQDIIVQNTGVKKLSLKIRTGKKAVAIHYGGHNVCKKILDYLYKDSSIYLKRKHDKYLKYCTSAE
jgi:intein-encoded DNA endonuclease-like protein